MAKSRKDKPEEHSHLELTKAFFEQFVESEIESDLQRVGVVWAGILGIDKPISASTVSALLSSYDLVLATALVESENHWARAAAFAVMGSKAEPEKQEEKLEIEGKSEKRTIEPIIGFRPSFEPNNEKNLTVFKR
jgi:hypothetical protein